MKRTLVLTLALLVAMSVLSSCTPKVKEYDFGLDTSSEIMLTIWGSMTDFPALEPVIHAFETTYPNCTVIYKLLDAFDENIYAKLKSETATASMFLGYRETFRNKPELADFALDYSDYDAVGVDMRALHKVLTDSAICDDGGQYVIPLGLESRGLAVNTTLLKSHGLDVPRNYAEFTAACDKLVQAGLVPIQTYHDECVMQLMYPYIANSVVHGDNYESVFASMNAKEPGTSQYLAHAFAMLDDFTRRGYISYKENSMVTAAHYNVEGSYQAACMNFLEGDVAFCPTTASCFCSIESKETLSPEFTANPFEYKFIAAPIAEDGSYGYLQPWMGICINKLSDNTNWSRAFVNFLCKKENMASVAERKGFIPNSEESVNDKRFDSILNLDDAHITNLSMFTNTFYTPLRDTLSRLGQPFEYAGEKGIDAFDNAQTYYIKRDGVYTAVQDISQPADGTALYRDCFKKRAVASFGDDGFAPLADTAYYILTDGAYQPVSDFAALSQGEALYVDDFNQVGKIGDEKFTPDDSQSYYILTGSGFVPAELDKLIDDTAVFVRVDKIPYRMNAETALTFYEKKIAG